MDNAVTLLLVRILRPENAINLWHNMENTKQDDNKSLRLIKREDKNESAQIVQIVHTVAVY